MTNPKIKLNMDSLKSRREWKRHKVKDGHNSFRILPPFGEASNGYVFKKWQVIWGLADPESGRARPFASSMTSEKRCPVYEFVQELKKKAELMKSQLQAAGVSEEDIKAKMTGLNQRISDLTPKTVYVYNAADQAGEVGLLELKATAHKKMKDEMSAYIKDYNQDPTSINSDVDDSGVWFDVIREGKGRDTEYNVKRLQRKVKNAAGKLTFEDDQTPLPENVVENFDSLGYDLSSIYQVKTYDELSEILAANLDSIIDECPEADLNEGATPVINKVASRPTTPVATVTSAAPKKTITLKLDDEDSQDEEYVPAARTTSKTAASTLDDNDSFLAEADALLNS